MREIPFLILWWLTLILACLLVLLLPVFLWIPAEIIVVATWIIFGAGYLGNYVRR